MNAIAAGFGAPPLALDNDGVRTLIVRPSGTDARGVLVGRDPATGIFESSDDFTIPNGVTVRSVAVASAWSSSTGNVVTPFSIATGHGNATQTRIELVGYRGYAPGSGYTMVLTACGTPPPIQSNGVVPALGNTFTVSMVTTYPLVGFLFGRPAWVPLTGICPCGIAVDGSIVAGSALPLTVPLDASIVGEVFSIQGFTLQSGPCFSGISFTNTIDVRIL